MRPVSGLWEEQDCSGSCTPKKRGETSRDEIPMVTLLLGPRQDPRRLEWALWTSPSRLELTTSR
jgi:hypothetical protein